MLKSYKRAIVDKQKGYSFIVFMSLLGKKNNMWVYNNGLKNIFIFV